MKNFIKTLLFILIFYVIWQIVFSVIWTSSNSITKFYDEPKNSLDVIYVGSSNAYAHFNTVLAYDLHGFTTGMLSSDGQPFSAVKYLLEEGRKYQNPEVYVVDINSVATDVDYSNEGDVRKVTDNMKFSKNRNNAIEGMLSLINVPKEQYSSFYFSFLTYHNSWKYIGDYSFVNNSLYKGHLLSEQTIKVEAQEKFVWKDNIVELPAANVDLLKDLINYIRKNNLEVIFVVPPRVFTDENMGKLNDAIRISKENNITVLNMNVLDDFEINYSKDLYNAGHINVYGATKFTKYFADYLVNNYELRDHRNDKKYKSWDSEYERYVNSFKELTNEDFSEI